MPIVEAISSELALSSAAPECEPSAIVVKNVLSAVAAKSLLPVIAGELVLAEADFELAAVGGDSSSDSEKMPFSADSWLC